MRNNQSVRYFGESESCPLKYTAGAESSKFELNTFTGDLTIRNLDLYEVGDYYVLCDEHDEWPKYTLLKLNIQGKFYSPKYILLKVDIHGKFFPPNIPYWNLTFMVSFFPQIQLSKAWHSWGVFFPKIQLSEAWHSW